MAALPPDEEVAIREQNILINEDEGSSLTIEKLPEELNPSKTTSDNNDNAMLAMLIEEIRSLKSQNLELGPPYTKKNSSF